MATYEQLSKGYPDGVQIGDGATDLVGFYGATPIVQRSGSAQAALTLTTAKTAGFGFTTATAFTKAANLLVEIRAALVALGLIKGSA